MKIMYFLRLFLSALGLDMYIISDLHSIQTHNTSTQTD